VLHDYGISFVTESVVADDVLGQAHLHAIIEQVEEMIRTTCHIVVKPSWNSHL